ncbi:hypothetical protein [Lactococcus lactis]|uniref:hypothetical protein n=1 Tax=Lactococcus lactis TaxID=1358 RepID=UPI002891695B|nr:hypothetical protein [Lactococcus lactis]MDT2894773.1 hypothetical protein [Lactococcus lactis]
MKIVASNSLTISNVNDGTITHIAYANIKFLCKENSNFTLSGVSLVRYGSDSRWFYKELQAGTYTATNTLFGGDPASGTQKNVELVSKFSTSNSINTTHIGVYVDFIESDSVDPSKYNWTLVKGADGTQGTPGKPGADGKTPYFHTAYAYSADGTDRFTTVYPNLNLGYNTKTFAGADGAANTITGSIRIDSATQKTQDGDFYYLTSKSTRDNYDWFRFFLIPDTSTPNMTKVTVKPNTKYTFSVWLKGTGQHTIFAYKNWTAPNIPWFLVINLTSDWKLYTFTVTSNTTIPARNVQFFIRSNNATEISLKKPKVEEGSVATIWMPSSSEVKTGDWPSYIGQYTDFTQADSTNPSNYTWSLIRGNDGKDGNNGTNGVAGKDGVGIKTTVITYAISTNGTTAPASGWTSSVPSLVKGQFLWTKTVWTYTDNSSETGYSVTYISKDGNNGKDGIAGKDGVGLTSTSITYVGSTNGTTAPTTGWSPSVPSVPAGQFLWTKTVWRYSDNTSETGYSVAMMGPKGDKGNTGANGIAGKDGVGIKNTTITYVGSTSGTTAPTSGWTTTVPTVAAGSYLWTKTVWRYSDNTSETGYSVAKMGNTGATGPAGPPGSTGAPGKIVSNTEPISLFKGLTWKYSGTANLTASDGTVIHPNTEYYYNGTHWVINYLSANNLEANSITADLIDAKNLTITDGEFVSTIINGSVKTQTEIKDDHLLIYKMDTSHNEIHTIALKSDSGLGMTYQNSDTGNYTSAGVNFQGLFMQNNITKEFARLTPQGTKLSTDVPWTKLSLMNNFTGNIEYAIVNGTVYISASGVGVPAMTAGQWKQAAQFPTGSSAIPIRANRITAGDSGDGLSWALLSNQAGGLFIRCSANKAATANLFNAILPYPIG